MKFIVFLLSLLFSLYASDAWGYVPHEYPAIYTQQLGRIFLLFAFICVYWVIVRNRLYKQKGWRYLFLSVIFFILWDLDVFIGRTAELIKPPQTIGNTEGWLYFTRDVIIERLVYLYYIGRLDFFLLNVAMLLFYLGLKEHLREVRKEAPASATAILPLLPILITDMAGSIVFIVLSMLSLNASITLYRKDRENVLWNYMVWLSSSWVMFSISRAFGHILRHILIPTGNEDIWKFFEPIAGSFNTFALFLVGSISLFFIWIYRSYLEISGDKRDLENLVVERTQFIEQLEKDKIELKELDKLKSAFLANVSHELRTPMNTIIGYTELLLDKVDGPVNEEQEKSLKKVVTNARHLLQLINDVLDVSKIESGKVGLEVKELDLRWLVDSVIPMFEPLINQKGISLSVKTDEGLPIIYGDEERIKQILINLLSNAVKFTHKGKITISARLSDSGIKPGEPAIFEEVCIEDTGIGIKEEDLSRIFDKFVQVDPSTVRLYEGTGLGLSIVRGLVLLHKGNIWVESKYGEGSRFCFTLPIKKEIYEKPAKHPTELTMAGRVKNRKGE
jgi:signal transduction histidine kinase